MPLLTVLKRITLSSNGYDLGSWAKVEGLNTVWETVDDAGSSIIRTPSQTALKTILLTRPQSGDTRIRVWHQSAIQNQNEGRKNCLLAMFDQQNRPVATYNLTNAWPSKIENRYLTSVLSTQLMVTVTLVCDLIQRVR